MISATRHNLAMLVRFHLYTSLAISLAANWVVTDLLLLQMKFDLTRFGVIKSNMFLLPAICYFVAASRIGSLNRDREICGWCYLLRCALPLLLPVMALTVRDPEVLLWGTLAVFAASYTCAMFANNTLLKIFRRALPSGEFNRYSVLLPALLTLPGALLCIPAVWLLNRYGTEPGRFLLLFLLLQAGTLLFEYPAFATIRALRITESAVPPMRMTDCAAALRRDGCRPVLLFTGLHGIWMGLVATYFVVYLLKVRSLNPAALLLIEFGLAGVVLLCSSWFGKLADRFGYAPVLLGGALLLTAAGLLWSGRPDSLPLLLLFTLLAYNGCNGVVANLLRNLENSAAAALAPPQNNEFLVAVSTLLFSAGCFAGCLAAGPLFARLDGNTAERFHLYFRWCALLPPAMLIPALLWHCRQAAGNPVQP